MIKQNYHDSLYFMIKEMLSVNPSMRPDLRTLSEKMLKNPKAISA